MLSNMDILAIAPHTLEDQKGNEWVYYGSYNFKLRPTPVRALRDIRRIAELELVLQRLGYCTDCMRIPEHSVTEPTSSCRCGTGEDYAAKPLQELQVLKRNKLCNLNITAKN